MLEDVRSGQLESACKALDQQWAADGATYRRSQEILLEHKIGLWTHSTYNRIRFLRWLFKAEGMSVEMTPEEWDLLTGMGPGAEKRQGRIGGLRASTTPRQLALSCANSPQPLARHTISMT